MGRYFVAFINMVIVPKAFEHPPGGFNVALVVGDVGVIHIEPDARALGHGLPFLNVPEDAFATTAVELLNSENLNLVLGLEAEFFFDFKLHRQAVRVPSTSAQRAKTSHGLVAEEYIFERARQNVVNTRATVGSWGPFVEDEERRICA